MALTTIDDRGLKTPIDLLDNEKIRFGTGNDLELYHDASNSFTINNTGNYLIKSAGDVYLRTATNEEAITATANGAVALYYDNVKKFQTISSGVRLLGPEAGEVWAEFYADEGDDNADKWRMGASVNTDLFIQNYASGSWETNIKAIGNGAVELYYDNSKKLDTYTGGVIVHGELHVASHVVMEDNDIIKLGSSADLQLFHDGSNSYLRDATAGHLRIENDNIRLRNGASNETMFTGTVNDKVSLYYDNSEKLATTSTGASVLGSLYCSDNLNLTNDNKKINFGDSSDLQLFHDGSHSFIDNSTGELQIRTAYLRIRAKDDGEDIATFNDDAGIELFYDGSAKLATTSSGGTLYGDWLADASFLLADSDKIKLGNAADLQIYHDGTTSYIDNVTGNLEIRVATNEKAVACAANGQVELYYDNSKKFNTTGGGCYVHGNLYPTSNGSGSIGTNTEKWNSAYFSANINVGGASNVMGTTTFHGSGGAGGSIMWGEYDSSNKFRVHNNGTVYAVSTTISSISSERRTKENIVDIETDKAWSTLKDIKLYSYSFKNDQTSTTHYGPIADEVPSEMVVPTDNSDDVGVINTYNSEMLLFRAYSALQQAITRIETLETEVAALKAK